MATGTMAFDYFVCTLGQAAIVNEKTLNKEYANINELIDFLAENLAQSPAVGFPSVRETCETKPLVFSFSDIQKISINLANVIHSVSSTCTPGKPVGLLCQSSPAFLFSWLALVRLGHPVLLIAPQLAVSAISSLCKTSEVSVLFYDAVYKKTADSIPEWLRTVVLPFTTNEEVLDLRKLATTSSLSSFKTPKIEEDAVAYFFHTSGTSSGLPKPIPQTHHAAVCVLPHLASLENNPLPATFSTTPLYHGGIADLLRSWTSGAMIWLFPAYLAPITAPNINKCLDEVKTLSRSQHMPHLKYFSSVPYVLQLLAANSESLQRLQAMELVGVGGAALPSSLGDNLVEQDVNLVSRYGSAECGFLLSSHREYASDKEWQYLRTANGAQFLEFEPQNDADRTYELVIKPGWPHMAKKNRDDGSYATSDLFVKHAGIGGAWKYHSRKDAQLTLVTGKKFDPAPLESAIVASTPLISEALVFGDGETYPGALIFRSKEAEAMRDEEFVEQVWEVVQTVNEDSQEHAKLARSTLVPMSSEAGNKLEKSSKGTLLRKQAEEKFRHIICKAYSTEVEDTPFVPDDKLQETILETVKSIVRGGEQLTPEADLFSFGMDSATSMQIRSRLRRLLPRRTEELPLTVVEDNGNVNGLSKFITQRRHGDAQSPSNDNDHALMQELVDRYSTIQQPPNLPSGNHQSNGTSDKRQIVVLTGATGALGCHVLAQLVASPDVAKIYCLVRGATAHAARERVSKGLEHRGLAPLPTMSSESEKAIVVPARLSAFDLGLSSAEYDRIASNTTLILHLAWSVNFRLRLANFEKESIASVPSLLHLALSSPRPVPPAFVFCSSLASASSYAISSPSHAPKSSITVPEEIIDDPAAAAPLGYARSKWVAEHVCHRVAQTTCLRGRVGVLRVGQLAGDTERGVWNAKEAWPLMLSSVRDTRTLPALRGEVLDWLAVDVAARAVVEAAMTMTKREKNGLGEGDGMKEVEGKLEGGQGEAIRVFHVLNEHLTPTWMDMLGWLGRKEEFQVVEPREWLRRVEELREERPEHPVAGLLGLWREAYGNEKRGNGRMEQKDTPRFAMEKSKGALPTLRSVRPIDVEYFEKVWEWIKTNM